MAAFGVHITVRGYELDTQGHLNGSVYHQYAEHARWECLRAAGVSRDGLASAGVAPVLLEATIRFSHELLGGDEVIVSCEHLWGDGKVYRLHQTYTKVDGTRIAELTCVCGTIDLTTRRLIPDPAQPYRELASEPTVLNL
jgi:acyl-CoA thioester hydrolase